MRGAQAPWQFLCCECSAMSTAAAPAIAVAVAGVVIPIVVGVPSMIMFEPAARSVPVTLQVHLSVVPCRHPVGTGVRWPGPISVMPHVTALNRIPICLNPYELRVWGRWWSDIYDARWRRRANLDSDRNLGPGDRSADQHERSNKCRPNQSLHAVNLGASRPQVPVQPVTCCRADHSH
jgi:hypothetical protein